MMTTGGISITAPLARGVLKRIKNRKCPEARVAATALASACDPIELVHKLQVIELKRLEDIDPTSWKDVHGYVDQSGRNHKGIAQTIVGKAEFGGRTASDVYDYIQRRQARNESASVGKFKITENSPNTARITVGPDQRERRKKYVWERVGVQRQLAGVAAAGLIVGSSLLHARLSKAGGGSVATGAKNIIKGTFTKTRNVISKAVGGGEVRPFIPEKGPLEKAADVGAEMQRIKETRTQAAAKSVATRLKKYGEKPTYEPILHPEDHPDVLLRGKPTGKKKLVRRKTPTIPFAGNPASQAS